ncbi:MAG: HD domain-containing protein [Eggerthellaceae bacterium]|nr:HD domain-containing protein [Eggerthellaceae bacterium]
MKNIPVIKDGQADRKRRLQGFKSATKKQLIAKTGEVNGLQNAILYIVADIVESRDDMTGSHMDRTQVYLKCLIDALRETSTYSNEVAPWNMDLLLPSSQLHDLGKIAISDAILNKPGKLTHKEYEVMKTHSQIGVDAICRMESVINDSSFLEYAKTFAGTHHERWDGKGYPNGISGEDIPLEGRLLAIVDVYDALVSARPYKKPFSAKRAQKIITDGRGTRFDPLLIDVFETVSDQFAAIASIPPDELGGQSSLALLAS